MSFAPVSKSVPLHPIVVSGLLLIGMFGFFPYASGYARSLSSLAVLTWDLWTGFDQWTHGIIVFPLAGGLLWWKRKELAAIPARGSGWGLPLLALGCLCFWAGYAANLQYLGYVALQALLAGLVVWFAGIVVFNRIFFIWLFLLFAYPFVFLEALIAFPLRLLMSECAFHLLNLIGVGASREGTAVVSAPDVGHALAKGARFAVDVADPCSGMHSLYALWMVSCLCGILLCRQGWKIMLVILAALPLALVGNLVRILILTFGTIRFGSGFAIGSLEHPTVFHTGAGVAVYLIALAGLLGLTHFLNRIHFGVPARTRCLSPRVSFPSTVAPRQLRRKAVVSPTRANIFRTIVVAAFLGGTMVMSALMGDINSTSEAGVKMQLPESFKNYIGLDEEVTESERIVLPKDTAFVKARYIGTTPPEISCEIVLSGTQTQSLHRPQVCLTGQGWAIKGEEPLQIRLMDGHIQKVRLLSLTHPSGERVITGLFLYWYIGKDKTTDDQYERVIITSLDRILHHVNHRWAYVIVSTAFMDDQFSEKQRERAKQALVEFTQQLAPAIQKPEVNRGPEERAFPDSPNQTR